MTSLTGPGEKYFIRFIANSQNDASWEGNGGELVHCGIENGQDFPPFHPTMHHFGYLR